MVDWKKKKKKVNGKEYILGSYLTEVGKDLTGVVYSNLFLNARSYEVAQKEEPEKNQFM